MRDLAGRQVLVDQLLLRQVDHVMGRLVMRIDPSDYDSRRIYYLMMSCVTPRPIAWVSTVSREGIRNLAPFSFYNAITSKPPLLSRPAPRPHSSLEVLLFCRARVL